VECKGTERSIISSVIEVMGLMLACRTFKDAQSKEQYAGAVRCAVLETASGYCVNIYSCDFMRVEDSGLETD